MKLRQLRSEDEATVKNWLRDYLRAHVDWWSEAYGTMSQVELETLVQDEWEALLGASQTDDCFVKLTGNQPLGIVYAELRHEKYLGFKVGVLSWIYVAREARGQNVSTQLMDAANAWMKSKHVHGLEVFVTAQNPAAVKLYERHGYKIIDHRMLAEV